MTDANLQALQAEIDSLQQKLAASTAANREANAKAEALAKRLAVANKCGTIATFLKCLPGPPTSDSPPSMAEAPNAPPVLIMWPGVGSTRPQVHEMLDPLLERAKAEAGVADGVRTRGFNPRPLPLASSVLPCLARSLRSARSSATLAARLLPGAPSRAAARKLG